ncbi:hypothetical protein [Nocardia brevicatena]|uniref:hypothetical protein n=1 Tax=Nocardia brevicatena TaxID=37327 RepID=UPI000309A862|nr:hypothetical protein [Nocardia brevicatena]
MTRTAPTELINRWRLEKCGDTHPPSSLEHARFLMSTHAGHGGCHRYLDGLSYATAVM